MMAASLLPALILLLLLFALWKRQPVFDQFLEGCREGLRTAVSVLPSLAAMMIAIAALTGSGLLDALLGLLSAPLRAIGMPAETAPLFLLRPLSGSASLAMVEELISRHGPDSRIGLISCTMVGSSETIFYTVCLYLGAIREKRAGYAIPCALLGATAGMLLAAWLY